MSEENVEVRIDALVGGNAANKLKDIATEARQAAQEADRLHRELDSPFTATPSLRATGNATTLSQTLTPQISQAAFPTTPLPGMSPGAKLTGQPLSFLEPKPIAAAVSLAGQSGQGGVPPGATVGVDMLTRKIKEVDTASGQLAMTYQLLEEKQSTLAKTAQRGYRTDQPISFLEPQPNKPSVYGLAEDRLPKPKWSTERETIPVAGAPPVPQVKPSTQPKPAEEEKEDPEKRIGRGLRGLLNQLGTESANMISKTMLAGFVTQMAGSSMSWLAGRHDVYSNISMSSGEKFKQLTEGIPIIGSLIKGFRDLNDATSGLNEKVRQTTLGYAIFLEHQAIAVGTKREQEPLSTRLVEMSAQATNAARFRPEYSLPQVGNPYQLQQYQRNVPITRQLYEAQAEQSTAESLIADAAKREQNAREQSRAADAQLRTWKDALARLSASGATEKELHQARLAIAAGDRKKIDAEEEVKRAMSDRAKGEESLAKASSSERQAMIGFKKNELADIDDRETKLRGRYQTFGGMQAGTRSMALQAARQAKALGYESLGEYQKGLIKQVAPDYAKEREEEIGKKYGADEFAKLIPSKNEDQRTLGELQRKQIELNQEINVRIDMDAEKFKKDLVEKVGDVIKALKIELGKIEILKKDEASNKKAMEAAGGT